MRNRNHIRDRYLGKRRSLIVKRKILFCIVIILLTGIVLAQASSIAEGIVSVAGNYDARVKLRETPRGKVIGQYYTGAHYTADEEKDGWVRKRWLGACDNRRTFRLDDEILSEGG